MNSDKQYALKTLKIMYDRANEVCHPVDFASRNHDLLMATATVLLADLEEDEENENKLLQ